ncbi:hypothetical protein ACFRJ3_04370 [Streptomyces sp. NPDC056696]|uniref:hypothetical protein n=1 Tax=unclassified Streptomyces TaxID=2593676 RepID=UPI00367C8AF8
MTAEGHKATDRLNDLPGSAARTPELGGRARQTGEVPGGIQLVALPITALVLVSKLLRHPQLATTAGLYAHLTGPAAARDARPLDTALTRATLNLRRRRLLDKLRPPRDHHPSRGAALTGRNTDAV